MKIKPKLVHLGSLGAIIATVHAAPVTFSAPTSVTDQNVIDLSGGTVFHAGTWGTGAGAGPITVTVGSQAVVFQNMVSGNNLGLHPATAAGGEFFNADVWVPPPGATPSTEFQNVMDGMAADGGNPKPLILGGLTVGVPYRVQLFASDMRGGEPVPVTNPNPISARTVKFSDSATNGPGAGINESTVFSSIPSTGGGKYVIGTFTATATTQTIYVRGVSGGNSMLNAYVLVDLSADTDTDGIPDHYEDSHSLNKNNINDAALDNDADGLSNIFEYQRRLNPNNVDTDGDLLSDGLEVNTYGSSPYLTDTDGDTIADGTEVNHPTNPSNPTSTDTDGDLFPDRWESAAGSDLMNNKPALQDTPNGTTLTVLGTVSTTSNTTGPWNHSPPLLGSDLTDPDNNGSDATPAGSGYETVAFAASPGTAAQFRNTTENTSGVFDIFDNKIHGANNNEGKWCCSSPTLSAPQWVRVFFNNNYTSITHFTVTSHNDAPELDPRIWALQGSNDGVSFVDITRFSFTPAQIWTARNQTIRVNLPTASLPYKYVRFAIFASGSTTTALSELELFGVQNNTDGDGDGMPKLYEDAYASFLNDAVSGDATADQDGDTLNNLAEFNLGTNPTVQDSDGDTRNDNVEAATPAAPSQLYSNPLVADTDGDGLSDGAEVAAGAFPNDSDSDDDFYLDLYEVNSGTSPISAASVPYNVSISGLTSLLTGDVTDPENDGNDGTANGSGFNWASITTDANATFTGEGAFNVFDNKLGGDKWCCDPAPPRHITVQMPASVSLTHFTLSSSNDSPNRDPRDFAIQGSNDGVTFTDIFKYNDLTNPLWTARNQVLRFSLPSPAPNYTYLRFQVTSTGSTSQIALGEIEYFGVMGSVSDTDGDGMPNFWEDLYGLNSNSNTDKFTDLDGDGLNNFAEYEANTIPNDTDTDDDELVDGQEAPNGGNPLIQDTDGDGLFDGPEVNNHGTAPDDRDSDDDNFSDSYELAVVPPTDPNEPGSTPFNVTLSVLGTGQAALLDGDITDRDNDGADNTAAGSGFDWTSITSTVEPYFGNEGAFDIFDNKLGGDKWCCDPAAPQSVTVQMPYTVKLTHFTATSSNDSPARDPRVWSLQGSNDGVTFVDIYTHLDTAAEVWTARDQVLRFDLPTAAPAYKWFRFHVTSTGGTQIALGELELFGIDEDSDGDGMSNIYEDRYAFLNRNNPADGLLDQDNDGLNNSGEFTNQTNILAADSDGDGLLDGAEANPAHSPYHGTNPNQRDTDGDGITDGYEVARSGDPLDAEDLPDFNPIDFGTPTNITGSLADFNTTGLRIVAWTGGSGNVTVGGIPFVPGPALDAREAGLDAYDRGGDVDYETLLDAGTLDRDFDGFHFLEIPNLIVGEQYRIQIWVADTSSSVGDNIMRRFGTYDAGDEQVVLNAGNGSNPASAPGQFVTGTFTAVSNVQYLYLDDPLGELGWGSQYNAITVYQTTGIPPKVTSVGFSGGAFQVTVENLTVGETYRLRRSTTLQDFETIGAPFTPASSTQVLQDSAPPVGKAFYIVEEVP